MKTELDKCLAGEWYDCHAPIFLEFKRKTHELLLRYNALPYDNKAEKQRLLKAMFERIGENVSVGHSFVCDYGCHISIGNNVSINTGCTFVDCNRIRIGNNVLIAPNVQIYTATHPIDLNERLMPIETERGTEYIRRTYALPVTIEDGCWIGGGVVILPGVTIGRGSVVGAGSVVTKSIPANSLAVGNPCKVIRQINHPYSPTKLIAFDLDGTVGDTLPMCILAFKKAMQTYTARMLSDEDIIQTFGLNEEGMARQIVKEEYLSLALNDFYQIYEELHKKMCPNPFTGIRELMAELKRKGIIVALVTGKGEKSCDITLRQFNMKSTFDMVLTGNAERNVKSDSLRELLRFYRLSASEMVYVGDTLSDITECRKADVRCLSAAWNKPSSAVDLERENVGNVFRSISALSEHLMSII